MIGVSHEFLAPTIPAAVKPGRMLQEESPAATSSQEEARFLHIAMSGCDSGKRCSSAINIQEAACV